MNAASLSLKGKIAVIVGGTAGIGRAISLGLAEAGAAVIASARNTDKVDSIAAELEAKDCSTLRVTCDVASRASLEDLLQQVLQRFGKVDILVNCAAKIRRAPTVTFPEDEWNDILDTNLTGTLRSCQIFGKYMLERKYGRIINIASLNSFVSLIGGRCLRCE
jgi:NAD(P)-dependent dehydrogenase (short-subunit alcohol dehydrogenase family)